MHGRSGPQLHEHWLSVIDFAQRYNVSERTVRRWLQAGGILHTWQVGKQLRLWNQAPPHFDATGARIGGWRSKA